MKLTQISRKDLSNLRWGAQVAGDQGLYEECEQELERRDIEEGALVLLAA